MLVAIIILIIVVCLLLGLVVLIQNPKGGGVSAAFGGVSNQILGASRSTNVVEKATWGLAIALLVLSLGSAAALPKTQTTADEQEKTRTEMMQENGTLNTNMGTGLMPTESAQPTQSTEPTPVEE